MRGNKSRDTAPELAVRRELFARGLRYRVAARPLPDLRRTADIVFPSQKIAVFLDGCYWHGCPDHYVASKSHSEYWAAKIHGNRARDRDTDTRLTSAGWLVLRFWQHQDHTQIADDVEQAVRGPNQRARHSNATDDSTPDRQKEVATSDPRTHRSLITYPSKSTQAVRIQLASLATTPALPPATTHANATHRKPSKTPKPE
jgi:DNA mismatch endonuclease (patch repair protein)